MSGVDKIKIGGKLRAFLLLLTVVVFVSGSVWIWLYVYRSVNEQRNKEFLRIVDSTQEGAVDSITGVAERLYDLKGFMTSGEVTSEKWNNFMLSAGMEKRFGGAATFAFAPRVEKNQLESYLNQVRTTEKDPSFEKYAVFPASDNAEIIPIRYLSTSDQDLAILLGYDLGTSENNVAAIKTAVVEDSPTMTELLHIGIVIPGSTKTGYIIMLPVYSRADIEEFPKEQKRKYFVGLVGTWIFPEGLMNEMEKEELLEAGNVKLSVYDGEQYLFSLGSGVKEVGGMSVTRNVALLNKTFRFEYVTTKVSLLSSFTESLPFMTAIGLILVNLMWIATVSAILLSRREAVRIAEEATKDLRKFKQAVEGVSDQVIIMDIDGIVIYVNRAMARTTGYKREELVGTKASSWEVPTESGFNKRMWRTVKDNKKPFWGETVMKRKNGDLYEVEIHMSPILDERGKLLFFVAVERDLSGVRAMEKMKTEFISLASHQLRTPLSAVKWFGQMLLSGDAGKLSQEQRSYVQKINESNEREIALVNSLLNVSRIESGKIVITAKPTNLSDLVETAVIDLKKEADAGKKKMTLVMDKKIPEMVIDSDLVRHVYLNLISNAIRYTKTGGKVLVKVFLDKNRVVTEVKDNGIGVPSGERGRVFEKFFRASNALKKETDGNGLGLYLSKTIVESSGGRIGFRTLENVGSTFWFTLPIKKEGKRQR